MALPQLFGIIPTGCPVIVDPSSAPAPTSLLFNLPPRAFSHVVVFILPGITLPPDTAAAVYLATATENPPNFKFLGGLGPGKESAIFKITGLGGSPDGEVDMDAPEGEFQTTGQARDLILGIDIESASSVAQQMAALTNNQNSASRALTLPRQQKPDTLLLAQRIIKNEFNFLASFSGNVGDGGVEVVPLKAFEDWWRKFEGRVRSDPGFLERDVD